jgi:diacylglycerol kinase family enzyme
MDVSVTRSSPGVEIVKSSRQMLSQPAFAHSIPRRRLTVVLNRESGTLVKLGPEKVEEGLREIFEAQACRAEIQLVTGKQLPDALREARESDADAVIVGGGDGTVASAATVLAGSEKALGILPLGTFNLAARDVGMPLDWAEAAKLLISAPESLTDLLEVEGRLYLCVVVLGFYPSLAMGQPEYHGSWVMKTLRTLWHTLRGAATYPPLRLRLTTDAGVQSYHTRLALIANNDYEDMFGIIPRRQSLDGGYFTVYISRHHSLLGLASAFLSWTLGRWNQDREISTIRTTELEIDVKRRHRISVMMDGELEKIPLPFTVRLRPKALRIISPRSTEE